MNGIHDIVIIGGGPAGLTAGLYAARARMNVLLLEKAMPGGQILIADRIENFPGFPNGVAGPELAGFMEKQALNFGLSIKTGSALKIMPASIGRPFRIKLSDGNILETLSLIVATGASRNQLGIPGERELTGRGVSYCATCDGPLFKGKDVIVVGGGDTALEDGLFLTKFAKKVTIVHRKDRLRAAKILQERALANSKIELCLNSIALEVIGKNKVDGLKVKDVNNQAVKDLKADGVFIFIGINPNSEIVKTLVKMDEKGYIMTGDRMDTSVEGIFACGDVRKKILRQVVTAAGEGASAAISAQKYVERSKGEEYPRSA